MRWLFFNTHMKVIQLETWKRKEHYHLFSQMDNPFAGVMADIECTAAYLRSKSQKTSIFSQYLFASTKAINQVDELKMRVVDNQIVVFDTIDCGTTVLRNDGTFAFTYIPFENDFEKFCNELSKEKREVYNSSGLRLKTGNRKIDMIHHSTFPWRRITGINHPRIFKTDDAIPKITFGKIYEKEQRFYLPTSIEVHHGLADGIHMAKYFDLLENYLQEPLR